MKITDIRLHGYRNYKSAELHLHSGLNILKGKNAQGKTNVLESVCLCSVGRSPKTKKDKDYILLLAKTEKGKTTIIASTKIDIKKSP